MNPNMRYAQVLPMQSGSGQPFGIIDFRNLWALLDAIMLMRTMTAISEAELNAIKHWFSQFCEDIVARCALEQANNIGVWRDLTVAAISLFIGDNGQAARILAQAPLRMVAQLSAFAVPHLEINRTLPLHYSLFNLQAWICLAWLARSAGVDLWQYSTSLQRSIAMQLRFIALNKSCFIDYQTDAQQYDRRIAAAAYCIPNDAAHFERVAELNLTPSSAILDDPNYGIPPLWPAFKIDC